MVKSIMADQVNKMKTMMKSMDDRDIRVANLTKRVENYHSDTNGLMDALNKKITDKTLKLTLDLQDLKLKTSSDFVLFDGLTKKLNDDVIGLLNIADKHQMERMVKIDKQDR